MVELQRTSRAVCCAKWSPEGSNTKEKKNKEEIHIDIYAF